MFVLKLSSRQDWTRMLTNERKLLICGVVKIVTELLFVVLLGGDNKHSHQSSMGFCFEIILFSPDYQNTNHFWRLLVWCSIIS